MTVCHCGANMNGSDHCPCCGCEEFERFCSEACPEPNSRDHSDHW
jgi:hypothetical protein